MLVISAARTAVKSTFGCISRANCGGGGAAAGVCR